MASNTELTRGQRLVQASIEKWKGYEDEDAWKIKDEFLNCIVDELNSKCEYNSQPEKWVNIINVEPILWNIFDVDYDIDDCKKRCVRKWDNYYGEWYSDICNSCKTIIDEKIRQPFTQTRSEEIREKIQMKKEIEELKLRVAKLEALLVDKL